ncbi:hypothetical protein POTG_00722 [Paenibacillus sp. oral taxon 786 str. D14]|nr:hypothetical protein POTG_00722 [Paenibacillus sp. oral taxon 786 str. D14]
MKIRYEVLRRREIRRFHPPATGGKRLVAGFLRFRAGARQQNKKMELTIQKNLNPLGETVNLFDKLSQGPVVLTFQNIFLNQFNLNLAEYNATNLWILPIPSTFMIDESGIIRSAYVEPYFMKRPDPEDILERLRQL